MLRRFRAAPRKQRARRAQAFFTTLRQAGPSQKSLPSVSSTSGYSGRDLPGAASAASAVSGASSVARRQLTHAIEPIGTRRLSPKPKLALSEVMSPLSEVSVEMMMRGPSIVCFPVFSCVQHSVHVLFFVVTCRALAFLEGRLEPQDTITATQGMLNTFPLASLAFPPIRTSDATNKSAIFPRTWARKVSVI